MDKIQKTYKTPRAFRIAMSDRVRKLARESGQPHEDIYRRIAIERFLARLDWQLWTAKGGYVFQRRFPRARRTKDIDLAIKSLPAGSAEGHADKNVLLGMLQDHAARDLGDYFSFGVEFDKGLAGFGLGGFRCMVRCTIDGEVWSTFQVDAILQPQTVFPAESLIGDDFFQFAGLKPLVLRVPINEEVFAQHLHYFKRRLLWSCRSQP